MTRRSEIFTAFDLAGAGRYALKKLPEVTLAVWVTKIAATTLGETAGDLFARTLQRSATNRLADQRLAGPRRVDLTDRAEPWSDLPCRIGDLGGLKRW